METIGLKDLANKVLQRNSKGNFRETSSETEGNFCGNFSVKVSLKNTFENLFREHAERLKKGDLTDTEIKMQQPDIYRQIQQAVKEMDAAWLQGDLETFKAAMKRIETLYFKSLY